MKFIFAILIISLAFLGCTKSKDANSFSGTNEVSQLYSAIGKEHKVQFQAEYKTTNSKIEDIQQASLEYNIRYTTKFLFGPLTYREIGGIQKGEKIQIQLDKAYIKDNVVMVPYTYNATWMIMKSELANSTIKVPVPFSSAGLETANWKSCTDTSSEEHSTLSFFWYFWDPTRYGCEHKVDEQYQEVDVQIGAETTQTTLTYPEYKNLIRLENGVPTMAMTFAFGYVEENSTPKPFTDSDSGMREFQKFYNTAKTKLIALGFKEESILKKEISANYGDDVIGSRFSGLQNGTQIRVSIMSTAGIDQMDLFAYSYAKKHEGFFGWFGHSRVGSGFDADRFKQIVMYDPTNFSISPDYQIVYWAGCNSYSYYTTPFFLQKAQLDPVQDPNGTKKLDLISNTLPSLFAFNAKNANVMLQALLTWETPTSYQSIVNQIEDIAKARRSPVIVNVLGDEDNSK